MTHIHYYIVVRMIQLLISRLVMFGTDSVGHVLLLDLKVSQAAILKREEGKERRGGREEREAGREGG